MKKFSALVGLLLLVVLLYPVVMLASYDYYIPITVYNNDSGDLTGLPILITLNNSQLVSLGYILPSGLDTEVLEGASPSFHSVVNGTLGLFIPSILGYQSRTYNYRLGVDPAQTNFTFMVGDGGYVNITDHADLELGDNFSIKFDGYIDADTLSSLVKKEDSFDLAVTDTDEISVTLVGIDYYRYNEGNYEDDWVVGYSTGTGGQSKESDYLYLWAEDALVLAERAYVTDATINFTNIDTMWVEWANTGDATDLQRSYFIVDDIKGGTYVNYDARLQHNNQFSRQIEQLDVSGVSGSVYIRVHAQDGVGAGSYKSELLVYNIWTSSLTDLTVTATGVSSGEHSVEVYANGTDFWIDIDSVTEDIESVGRMESVGDNSSNWTISAPYFNYYKHTVDGTQEAWYEPVTMILGTTLVDRSGSGHTGAITWGSNPGVIEVSIGGMEPYSSYVAPGAEDTDVPDVVPPPGGIDMAPAVGATGHGLPLYVNFQRAAEALEWTVPTTYAVMFMIVAIVVGVAGMVASKSIWGWVVGFGGTAALFGAVQDVGGYSIMPLWLTMICVVFAIFCGYIWRYT